MLKTRLDRIQRDIEEMAKFTWGNSSPKRSIIGTSPQVETVICLLPIPIPLFSLIILIINKKFFANLCNKTSISLE